MAYQTLIRTSEFPYHVTARANNREHFAVSKQSCWQIWLAKLQTVVRTHGPEIVSFVLMSNHIHMILWTPLENLDEVMRDLLKQTGRSINRGAGRTNHVFGTRYKWSLIGSAGYLFNAYKYLYRNPVEQGLSHSVEDYPYSTLFYLHRERTLPIHLCDERAANYADLPDFPERLMWMNQAYKKHQAEVLRRALRRKTFQYSRKTMFEVAVRSLKQAQTSQSERFTLGS